MASTRRLAAVMFTDTVGFTESVQADEALTLELLAEQQELVRSTLAAHGGQEVKSTGDGFLIEFDSALNAVLCAVEIQHRIGERNATSGRTPVLVRIGIHLGDVERRGSDILGDAVNIAARIEPMAEPGGVCVSGAVREQVWNKIPYALEPLPPAALKGLRGTTELYRLELPPAAEERPAVRTDAVRLAVLPFVNMSPDAQDEYFADGLTEEVITELSRVAGLRVIARTSVMRYKGTRTAVDVIGRELHVGMVLEGSVRRAGDRIRITTQLIDAQSQEHLWADRFDRDLVDIFEIQSEIAGQVAGSLGVKLVGVPLSARPPTRNIEAYALYLKGRTLWNSRASDSVREALECFQKATEVDPGFGLAFSGIADCYSVLVDRNELGWAATRPKALAAARRAVELSPDAAEAHASLGFLFDLEYEWDAGGREFRRAIEIAPNYAAAHHWYHMNLVDLGIFDDAETEITVAEQGDPASPAILHLSATFHAFRGRAEEALNGWNRVLELGGGLTDWVLFSKGVFLHGLGRREEAAATAAMLDALVATGGVPSEIDRVLIPAALRAVLGDRGAGEAALNVLLRENSAGNALPGELLPLYAAMGDADRFYEWLFRAIDDRSFNLYGLRVHPLYAAMRSDARYREALDRLRIPPAGSAAGRS
jgi:adenylate cyclase